MAGTTIADAQWMENELIGRASLALLAFLSISCADDCASDDSRAHCQKAGRQVDRHGNVEGGPLAPGEVAGCPAGTSGVNAGAPMSVSFGTPHEVEVDDLSQVVSADLNDDGYADIVGISNSMLVFFLGDGTGIFSNSQAQFIIAETWDQTLVATSRYVSSVFVADLDGDGVEDLLATPSYTDALSIPTSPPILWGGASFPEDQSTLGKDADFLMRGVIAPGDYNGDGQLDFVGCSTFDCVVTLNKGDRSWTASETLAVTVQDIIGWLAFGGPFAIDGDSDSKDEIVSPVTIPPRSWNNAKTYTRDTGGKWSSVESSESRYGAVGVVIDLDEDGQDDQVRAVADLVRVSWNDNGKDDLADYCIEGDPNVLTTAMFLPFSVGDFDADGLSDIVVSREIELSSTYKFSFLGGREGRQQFKMPFHLPAGEQEVLQIAVNDFNGDGQDDLLVRRGEPSGFAVLLNRKGQETEVMGGAPGE